MWRGLWKMWGVSESKGILKKADMTILNMVILKMHYKSRCHFLKLLVLLKTWRETEKIFIASCCNSFEENLFYRKWFLEFDIEKSEPGGRMFALRTSHLRLSKYNNKEFEVNKSCLLRRRFQDTELHYPSLVTVFY